MTSSKKLRVLSVNFAIGDDQRAIGTGGAQTDIMTKVIGKVAQEFDCPHSLLDVIFSKTFGPAESEEGEDDGRRGTIPILLGEPPFILGTTRRHSLRELARDCPSPQEM